MSFYKRTDGKSMSKHVGEIVQVVGTVEAFEDAGTISFLATEPFTAHIPGSVDVEQGEAYAMLAVVSDDTHVNVKSVIHIPKEEYDPKVVGRMVEAYEKHSDFFYSFS